MQVFNCERGKSMVKPTTKTLFDEQKINHISQKVNPNPITYGGTY